MLNRVQHCEQRAPGVPEERRRFGGPVRDQRVEIGHVLSPSGRRVAIDWRLSAASLVVVPERPFGCQRVELREEVIVMRAGATVKDDDWRS